ncbi:hypothetical protein TWF696_008675 [Orbilia brochopaga]|uniref:Uncharacterized protein n=1 Tax=Orbilia brochopaga TaxID=3140254 RepID=A0AAV9UGV3_9PEZI
MAPIPPPTGISNAGAAIPTHKITAFTNIPPAAVFESWDAGKQPWYLSYQIRPMWVMIFFCFVFFIILEYVMDPVQQRLDRFLGRRPRNYPSPRTANRRLPSD